MTQLELAFVDYSPASYEDRNELAPSPPSVENLEDVRSAVASDADISPSKRRDAISALKRLETMAGTALVTIDASAASVRSALERCSPPRSKISRKTFQNIRASVHWSLQRYASHRRPRLPRRAELDLAWQTLLSSIVISFQRHSLTRLARFCSQNSIEPAAVDPHVLERFYVALESEEVIKGPKSILKNTISNWNRAAREIHGWPATILSSPFKPIPVVFSVDTFPASFQAHVKAWQVRVSEKPKGISLFSDTALLRPLRPETVKSQVFLFRQVGTALVKSGAKQLEEITGLDSLCDPIALQVALQHEYERLGQNERRVLDMANKLRLLAKHFLDLPSAQSAEMDRLFSQRRKRLTQITEKNRERLTQFDDVAVYKRLSLAPAKAAAGARLLKNPYRAAKSMERAVAMSLLLQVAPRLSTLRRLEVAWFLPQPDGTLVLTIPPHVMKSGRALELALSCEIAGLLGEFLGRFRPQLPCSDSPYLFPGEKGGPRSKNAMYEAVVAAAAAAGVTMNPHLFRHLLQKVCAEVDPSSITDVSRVLAHASPSITYAFYSDGNGKAASRRVDSILALKAGEFGRLSR